MANKNILGRMQQKHDTSANGALATTFIPLAGEIIVYSDVNKFKIGDGTTVVESLPFAGGTEILANGILKGDGAGNISAAIAGTDYQRPIPVAVSQPASLASGDMWFDITAEYTITNNLTNVTKVSGPTTITEGSTATLVYAANDGYNLPDSVTVTGATSTWIKATGTLVLSNATGNVSVTVVGEADITLNGTTTTMPLSSYWTSVAYGGDRFVAIADYTTNAVYSTNGIAGVESTLPSNKDWYSITYGDGKFVAVANYGYFSVYSTNGITGTESTLPAESYWHAVTYGDGKFVAVAVSVAAYSTDGSTWVATTMPSDYSGESVTYGNNRFVAVCPHFAAYSTDGITWTESTLPSDDSWSSITYGNGKFVAVGSTSAAYSTDGITWAASTTPSAMASITYGDSYFVAIASNRANAVYSVDGINGTISTMPSGSWWSITYGDGKFVAVASGSSNAAYGVFE